MQKFEIPNSALPSRLLNILNCVKLEKNKGDEATGSKTKKEGRHFRSPRCFSIDDLKAAISWAKCNK